MVQLVNLPKEVILIICSVIRSERSPRHVLHTTDEEIDHVLHQVQKSVTNLSLVNKEFRGLLFRESYTSISIAGKTSASKMISLLRLVRWNDIIRKSIRDFHLHIDEVDESPGMVQEADIMFLEQTAASLGITINRRLRFLPIYPVPGRLFTVYEACKEGPVSFAFMASILLLLHLHRMEELFLEVSESHLSFIDNFCGLIEGIRFPALQSLALRGTSRGLDHHKYECEPSGLRDTDLNNLFIAAPNLCNLFVQRYHLMSLPRNTRISSLAIHGVYADFDELSSIVGSCEQLKSFIHVEAEHQIASMHREMHPVGSCGAFASGNQASFLHTFVLDFRPNNLRRSLMWRISSFPDFTQLRSLWISVNSLDNAAREDENNMPISNLPASLERFHLAGISWEIAEDLLWLADQIELGKYPRLREVCIEGEGHDITNLVNRFRECGIHADSKIDKPIMW
ncbi:hypothetical protein GCG54_00010679 [Colletotrichum gloeosporioides]|uniref:Uncharacterized protein n=1 Tax=Colletotrichum gloeosporioides TaxID=474922 RepID=A0A8H4C8B3_COLGL|nr:uncharacterized protein GCG54_00010679 [Colletotrichum gloeosporioides]KAF3799006.1 hypothetical protein GCG54_00010679 [Colletotrichum gloeosporioides]